MTHHVLLNAAPNGPRCQAAMNTLKLPNLRRLLSLLSPTPVVRGAATDLTPVHEHVLAASQSLLHAGDTADGLIPWAAIDARQRGLTAPLELDAQGGWAWITPCHWTVHADHVRMDDPQTLALTPQEADSLFQAMQPYFAEDGITLYASHDGLNHSHWLAHGRVFAGLPTASLERVAGQEVDSWIPRQPQAQSLRRLQNEMQMLLYTHPVNDARERMRLPSVSAFWISATGALPNMPATLPSAPDAMECQVHKTLQMSDQNDDAASWVQAWEALDSTLLAHALKRLEQGQNEQISLCGTNSVQTFILQPLNTWQRLMRRLNPPSVSDILKTL
jgi:hypothetical protein